MITTYVVLLKGKEESMGVGTQVYPLEKKKKKQKA